MRTINIQVWIPATQAAQIAAYMEKQGDESRRLADIARTAIETVSGLLEKKGFARLEEAEAVRFLVRRGFPIMNNKDKTKRVVHALQQEALSDMAPMPPDSRIAELERILQEQE